MMKHKVYLIILALMVSLTAAAQHDNKAKEILDKVANTYNQSEGLRIDFKGTQRGTIWVKGEKFVLECSGVKSWFNGQTQWSYIADNEEVNISSPTPEEIQSINPYALVTMYRNGFNYRYNGIKTKSGKSGYEIALTPEKRQDVRMFVLSISDDYIPYNIGVDMTNGHYEEFIVTNFQKIQLSNEFFSFDEKQYPDAEVIDLR